MTVVVLAGDMNRRRFLAMAGGGIGAVAGGVAVDNVLLGYGTVSGTNLHEQDLAAKVDERLGPVEGRVLDVAGASVELATDGVAVGEDTLSWEASSEDVDRVERDHGLPRGALAELVADVPDLWTGAHSVAARSVEGFFDRAADAETSAHTVAALRGPRISEVEPAVVERFAGVDPSDPREIADGLVDGFREHTFYDAPRYAAGAIEDNVLRRRVDLRDAFESPTDFRAMLAGENSGSFCYDFVFRSMEAFHAVPAPDQTVPVVAAYVRDARHKHAYTGLATVLRDDDGPTLLVTFLDYTPTTTAHSFGLTRTVGDDPDAYTERHRATDVYWNRRTDV